MKWGRLKKQLKTLGRDEVDLALVIGVPEIKVWAWLRGVASALTEEEEVKAWAAIRMWLNLKEAEKSNGK